jgi:hypothetical protein
MKNKAVLFLCLLVPWCCFGQFTPDSIRIAHIQWEGKDKPIPRQFLLSAKAYGYNYIMCEYSPYWAEWDHAGRITAPRPTPFEKRLAQHLRQVDSAGLRLIPNFTTATKHADWSYGVCIDTLIPRQLVHRKLPGATASDYSSFVLSPDSNNAGARHMNKAFDSVWTMVFNALDLARPGMKHKNLDFVHLGFDENCYCWPNDPLAHIIPLAGLCQPDTAWLAARNLKGRGTELQLQRLYAATVEKRVRQIVSIAKKHGCTTKTILWADMFDPDLYPPDVYSFKNLFDGKLQGNDPAFDAQGSLVKIRLVGTLRQPDMQAVRDDIIFCPWVYDTVGRGGRYVPGNVIDTFASCGFKVIFVCAGSGFFGYDSVSRPLYGSFTDAKYRNALEFAAASCESRFASKSIGFICADYSNIPEVDSRQGGLVWDPDSVYIRPFDFMRILSGINSRRK